MTVFKISDHILIDSLLPKLMMLNKTVGRTFFLDVSSLGDVNKAVDGRSLWRKDRTACSFDQYCTAQYSSDGEAIKA